MTNRGSIKLTSLQVSIYKEISHWWEIQPRTVVLFTYTLGIIKRLDWKSSHYCYIEEKVVPLRQ